MSRNWTGHCEHAMPHAIYSKINRPLKALIQPACFAGAISWLAFVVAIFMDHENGDYQSQPRGDMCKVCWLTRAAPRGGLGWTCPPPLSSGRYSFLSKNDIEIARYTFWPSILSLFHPTFSGLAPPLLVE